MTTSWYDSGLEHIWQPYAQAKIAPLPLPVSHTDGCYIVLQNGQRLIDGISSWWCTPHGHNHPHIVNAAKDQLDRMPNVMFAGLAHEPAYRLATRLVALMAYDTCTSNPLTRVFFSDSGSTAVEVALKIALQYWHNLGKPDKSRFACLSRAYHGDTFGAMGVSDPAHGMHAAYRPGLVEATTLNVPHTPQELELFEDALASAAPTLAALIVEPLVQGTGGMLFYDADMLRAMQECCTRHNVLLITDEIMTGFARTGTMFASEQAGITPDICCIGKGLTGGIMTMAATLTSEKIYHAFYDDALGKALMHGPTFMANPLACAIANASLDLFEREPRLQQVKTIAQQLTTELDILRDHPLVHDIRVRGAIGVVEMKVGTFDPFSVRPLFVTYGCWLRPYGSIIYIMPPYTITPDQLTQLTDSVKAVINTITA